MGKRDKQQNRNRKEPTTKKQVVQTKVPVTIATTGEMSTTDSMESLKSFQMDEVAIATQHGDVGAEKASALVSAQENPRDVGGYQAGDLMEEDQSKGKKKKKKKKRNKSKVDNEESVDFATDGDWEKSKYDRKRQKRKNQLDKVGEKKDAGETRATLKKVDGFEDNKRKDATLKGKEANSEKDKGDAIPEVKDGIEAKKGNDCNGQSLNGVDREVTWETAKETKAGGVAETLVETKAGGVAETDMETKARGVMETTMETKAGGVMETNMETKAGGVAETVLETKMGGIAETSGNQRVSTGNCVREEDCKMENKASKPESNERNNSAESGERKLTSLLIETQEEPTRTKKHRKTKSQRMKEAKRKDAKRMEAKNLKEAPCKLKGHSAEVPTKRATPNVTEKAIGASSKWTQKRFDRPDYHKNEQVVEVKGKECILSNFWVQDLNINGFKYTSGEMAYQHMKAMYFDKPELAQQILKTDNPLWLKSLGNEINMQAGHLNTETKLNLARTVIENRIAQQVDFRNALLRTGNKWIAHTVRDQFWGSYEGYGRNAFGEILMECRASVDVQ